MIEAVDSDDESDEDSEAADNEEFDENEDNNYHSENVVLLARYFGKFFFFLDFIDLLNSALSYLIHQ